MPFLSHTIGAQKTHFYCLEWGVLEFTSKEEKLLDVKNAQVITLQLLTFKNSLCLTNTSHYCSPSTVFKFALVTMLTTGSLTNVNPQKSPFNYGLVG